MKGGRRVKMNVHACTRRTQKVSKVQGVAVDRWSSRHHGTKSCVKSRVNTHCIHVYTVDWKIFVFCANYSFVYANVYGEGRQA